MRNVLTLLFIIVIPTVCLAQQSLVLGASGGFSIAQMGKELNVKQNSPLRGYNSTLKWMVNFRKTQLGIGVEMGSIKGSMIRMVVMDYVDTQVIVARYESHATITGSYKAPHGFVHYKINATDKLYFFAGPMVGLLMGNSQLLRGKFNSVVFGANAGMVFRLGSRLELEIQEGWRHLGIKGAIPPYFATYNPTTSNMRAYNTGHTLDYFTTSVGLHVRVGK